MASVGNGQLGRTLIGTGVTSSPTFAPIGTSSGLTANGIIVAQGLGAFQALPSGASGQIIRSSGPGVNPSYSTATYPNTSGTSGNVLTSDGTNFNSTPLPGSINFANVTLTSAQIKSLHGTPIQIVASPGAGKMICPLGPIYFNFIYGGTNVFVAAAAQTVSLYYATTTLMAGSAQVSNPVITGSASNIAQQAITNSLSNSLAIFENLSINAYNPIATEISGNAANNNTITLTFMYYIASL